jgi:salicylate hydroxylase
MTTSVVSPTVLIVGAGIAGLGVAAAFDRRGVRAEIVERSGSWPAEGAAITLHPNRRADAAGHGPGRGAGPGLGAAGALDVL